RRNDRWAAGAGAPGAERADEEQPAGRPRGECRRGLLRPLVDRAGQRILPRQLGEAERDEHLAGEDDRPRPPERGARRQEREAEQLEDAGQDRDVAESGGEAGETAEGAVQRLLVTELGELVRVDVLEVLRHCWHLAPPTGCGDQTRPPMPMSTGPPTRGRI